MSSAHFSSATCEWATPDGFADAYGPFDLDACADRTNHKAVHFFTKETDGLAHDWFGSVWMNPPYGRTIGQWVRKAYEEVQAGRAERVVCLLPSRTDTAWWHDYCMKGEISFIRGRLKFGGHSNSAPFPSAVVIFKA